MEQEKINQMIFPEAFAARMQAMLGEEYEAFVKSYDRPASHALRVNVAKISLEEYLIMNPFPLRQIPWVKEGFYYGSSADGGQMSETETAENAQEAGAKVLRPGKHPYHEAGLYYIQEPSAMAVGALAAPKPGERVLDLCAAPGGKTTHLASYMKGQGVLVANEPHPARARILAQNVERMGIPHAIVTNEYPQTLAARFPGWFDRIVVDAPCSGEGMFLKEEQALIHWSQENVQLCADRQDEILESAAQMLRPGGTMVYSTCTFAPEEDERSIVRFLRSHPDFHVKKVEAYEGFAPGEPAWAEPEEEREISEQVVSEAADDLLLSVRDTFRLWPHKLEGEGHYVAILQRDGDEEVNLESRDLRIKRDIKGEKGRPSRDKKGKKKGGNLPTRDFEMQSAYENFVYDNLTLTPEEILPKGEMTIFGDQLYRLPCALELRGLKVLRAGLHLGTLLKNRFEPSHALALSLRKEDALRTYALSSIEEAEQYLKGQTLSCDGENGWTLVTIHGYSLGWGKVSGGVLKNHYPKGLRWM